MTPPARLSVHRSMYVQSNLHQAMLQSQPVNELPYFARHGRRPIYVGSRSYDPFDGMGFVGLVVATRQTKSFRKNTGVNKHQLMLFIVS